MQCNFVVLTSKSRRTRVWERPRSEDVIVEANPNSAPAQRELTQYVVLKRFEGKS